MEKHNFVFPALTSYKSFDFFFRFRDTSFFFQSLKVLRCFFIYLLWCLFLKRLSLKFNIPFLQSSFSISLYRSENLALRLLEAMKMCYFNKMLLSTAINDDLHIIFFSVKIRLGIRLEKPKILHWYILYMAWRQTKIIVVKFVGIVIIQMSPIGDSLDHQWSARTFWWSIEKYEQYLHFLYFINHKRKIAL